MTFLRPARVLPLLAVPLAMSLLLWPTDAHAETAAEVARELRSSSVYQSPGIDLVDVSRVRAALDGSDPQVKVAVLPASAAPSSSRQAEAVAGSIGRSLGISNAVVLVVTENRRIGAAHGGGAARQGVNAGRALSEQLQAPRPGGFDKAGVTAFVLAFADRVEAQAANRAASGSGGSTDRTADQPAGGGSGTTLLVGLLLIGGVAALLAMRSSKGRKARVNEGLRADVEQLYNRLGSDVSLLSAGGNPVAQQALADAAERYNSCGATLAMADSPAEFAAARRTAVEGLTAARVARKELGLDPGPQIPMPAPVVPRLDADEQVEFGDQRFDGSPDYAPGRQHYYEGGNVGGRQVRGGWYSAPFWEPFLLGSLLSGGLGGGLFGAGSGAYERGYEEGREAAADDSSAGGDWGFGGGDWGGGGGGGDWGGGGGGDGGGGGGDW